MPKLPVITPKKLIGALERAGFGILRRKGSHVVLRHSDRRITVVPCHTRDIPVGTLKGILNDIGMSAEGLKELL
jgi:predicted RNA binding protein YcfA (HicA-like mRNA interferase family)